MNVSKLFLKLVCGFCILLISQLPNTALSVELQEDFLASLNVLKQEMKSIQGKSLLETIVFLESLSEKHRDSEVLSVDLSDYVAVEAIEHIGSVASDFNVVMVNEAHHLPQHRILTIVLLNKLWDLGYRYLALEALPYDASQFSNAEVISKGSYIDEPVFRYMLRHANQLGFKLISYDSSSETNASNQGIRLREQLAAEKIVEKIFEKDKNAKVIIHVGYDHINEKLKLGGILKSKLNKDILTISQTDRIEQHDRELEHPTYTAAEQRFTMNGPYLLITEKEGKVWSSSPESFDLSVFWPRVTYIEGRPKWASLERQAVPVDIGLCRNSFPCIVELFPSTDFDLTPSDRMLVRDKTQKVSLFARCEDKYIRALNTATKEAIITKLPTGDQCIDVTPVKAINFR